MVALFVVLTFVLFLVVDYFVLKAQGKKHPAFASTYKVFDKKSFAFPEDIFLAPNHLWLKKLTDGNVKLGIDEFILKSLSKVKLQNFASEGTYVKKGDLLFEGVFNNNTVQFRSPINGKVLSVNKNLEGKAITDCYADDWGLSIFTENLNDALGIAKTKDAAYKWLQEEFSKFKDFLSLHMNEAAPAGVTMHDGGNIVEGALRYLPKEAVAKFEQEFLNI